MQIMEIVRKNFGKNTEELFLFCESCIFPGNSSLKSL